MVTSHPLLSDVKRKWKMIPYAAGVIVPLALTLLEPPVQRSRQLSLGRHLHSPRALRDLVQEPQLQVFPRDQEADR
uniref:Uncharacterized protein n=1 Tax=Brassica oleracea TaxID=3712 RepID=A0A3P6DIQ6_BRAOL|nr:unnamed protein product [Brassica oleracea]